MESSVGDGYCWKEREVEGWLLVEFFKEQHWHTFRVNIALHFYYWIFAKITQVIRPFPPGIVEECIKHRQLCVCSCRLRSGWQDPRQDCELMTLCITKGMGTCGTAWWPDTETWQELRTPGFPRLTCKGTNPQGFLGLGSHLGGNNLKLLFCYCTVIKLFSGLTHLRMGYGKSGVKWVLRTETYENGLWEIWDQMG